MTELQQQHILSWINSETAESPLLFTGREQSELLEAVTVASALLACQENTTSPCSTCPGCKQLKAGTFPDIVLISGEEKTIKRKEVQTMLQAIANKPMGKRRLIIIPDAERLTRESATILLKALEDSSILTRYVLTTRYKRRLLPTILSRVQLMAISSTRTKEEPVALAALPRFGQHQGPLTEEEIETVQQFLQQQLQQNASSPYLLRSFMRFRDYCKIKSQRGNEKLAADVLLASLTHFMNTRA